MRNIKLAEILDIDIDLSKLPYVVQDIANIIGLENALKLVEQYKGIKMYVPSEFRSDHILCQLIGEANTVILIKNYGGETLDIPKCNAAILTVRNFYIRNSNKSQRQLAIVHGLTVRQIRIIKKKSMITKKC